MLQKKYLSLQNYWRECSAPTESCSNESTCITLSRTLKRIFPIISLTFQRNKASKDYRSSRRGRKIVNSQYWKKEKAIDHEHSTCKSFTTYIIERDLLPIPLHSSKGLRLSLSRTLILLSNPDQTLALDHSHVVQARSNP